MSHVQIMNTRPVTFPSVSSTPTQPLQVDEEVEAFVKKLEADMREKFGGVLDGVLGKVDEMSKRIDDLERHVQEMLNE